MTTQITPEQLELHAKYVRREPGGVRLVLRGADLSGAVGLLIAADAADRLRSVAVAALADDALEMVDWHTCENTHCIAGRAVAQAGELGRLLEKVHGTEIAGLLLLGPEGHKHFFDSNDDARAWLQEVLNG